MKSSILLLTACLVGVYNSCSAAIIEQEIFNGSRVVKGQFPFDVLMVINGVKGSSFCGGALISENWVMTAAHCFNDVKDLMVYAGFVDVRDVANGQKFKVTKGNIHSHPQYDPKTLFYDISLVQLPSAIKRSRNVNTINLPPKSDAGPKTYDGKIVAASGWGKTRDANKGINQFLMFKVVRVMPLATCAKYFRNINNKMICTDKITKGGPCPGDSGGPLIIHGANKQFEAIGIVSYGLTTTCENNYPVVYTQVAPYLDWINNVTGIAVK